MIIGAGYKARVGKDTIADYLIKNHGFKRLAFADSLKEACRQIFSLTEEQLYGNLKEVVDKYWGVTPRFILQKVGTDCLRENFDKDVWIKSVQRKIIDRPKDNWIITDVRFPNEAEAIHSWGGFVVRVDRPQAVAKGGIIGHASEMSMDSFRGWDYVLRNPSAAYSLLYEEVEIMLKYLKGIKHA